MSALRKLRHILFLKYICNISLFIRNKTHARSNEQILGSLAKSVIEIEKTQSLTTKERVLENLTKNKFSEPKSEDIGSKSRPNLKNLIPKIKSKSKKNETNIDDSDDQKLDEVEEKGGKYIPPKDKFVPYPHETPEKKITKSKIKKSILKESLDVDMFAPEELTNKVNFEIGETIKKKNQKIDVGLRYMDEDLNIEDFVDDSYGKKRKKVEIKRHNEKVKHKKKMRRR